RSPRGDCRDDARSRYEGYGSGDESRHGAVCRGGHARGWEGGERGGEEGIGGEVESLSPLPLPIRFALANAALFGYFFQRGLFVGLLRGDDFAHTLGNACGLGCGRSCPFFGFRDQERDFAFDVSSRLQFIQHFWGSPAEEFFVDLRHLA